MTDPHCEQLLARYERAELSPQIAIMELLIATEDVERVARLLSSRSHPRAEQLRQTFADNRSGCARIVAMLRAEQPSGQPAASIEAGLARWQQLFDQLVGESEEASVAFYSLGSAEILAAATEEVVQQLAECGLLSAHARVLDFGCGIGRMEIALAPRVAEIDGVDLSAQMVAVATRRTSGLANVRIAQSSGRDLAGFADHSKELLLAVDSFPYVVEAGDALVAAIFAEAARVLVAGGCFCLLNFSYRGDLQRDRRDVARLAAQHGFTLERAGEQPFRLWNGALFLLRRLAADGSEQAQLGR